MQLTTRQSIQHDPLLSLLARTGKTAHFLKRQIIFSVGDSSDTLFLIQSGIVKLTVTSREGTEAVTSVLKREHFFGPRRPILNVCHAQPMRSLSLMFGW